MKKHAAVTAVFLLGIWMLASPSAAQSEGSSPVPPKNLKKVGDHWTPWNPPEPGPGDYIIQKGDTLWDLSESWLGDPFLWPQIWDENRYILDSHWIYPGDPLVVPGRPTVIPPEGPPEEAMDTGQEGAGEEGPGEIDEGFGRGVPEEPVETVPAPSPLMAVADPSDLYCSGYIDPDHSASDYRLVGAELEREHLGQGDVVYLNLGRNQGVRPGEEFGVRRANGMVSHPVSSARLGTYVRRLGRIRIIAVQEETSTGLIMESCEDLRAGDELVSWEEIPVPMMSRMPSFDRYDVTPSGGSQGHVVATRDSIIAAGTGHIIHTDLGLQSAVEPGEVLTLFRDNGDLPRLMIGQAVVLTVETTTSTAKITRAVRETGVGDRVEIAVR